MERSDLIKLSVLVVVGLIVFSGFSIFGGGPTSAPSQITDSNNTNSPVFFRDIGSANLTGTIKKYGSELSIKPWKEEYSSILTSLRDEGQIDYANSYGDTAVLILSDKANITYVREKFLDKNVEASAEAVIVFNTLTNFTINNENETRELVIPDASLVLDPLADRGTEIDFLMVADIEGSRIISVQSKINPRTTEVLANGTVSCGEIYRLETVVPWENRKFNLTQLAFALNISKESIIYERNDAVFFDGVVNETVARNIIDANSSFITASSIDGILVNNTDKDEVELFLKQFNVSIDRYQGTGLIIIVNGNISRNIGETELGYLGNSVLPSRGCTITIDKQLRISGQIYLVEETARVVDYFLLVEDIENRINILGNVEYVGRVITRFTLQNILGTFEEEIKLTKGVDENMENETEKIGKQNVTFVTTKGTIKVEIYGDRTPITSANFLKLVKQGFYNNLTFHRYVAGFVIQGGDPQGNGMGGSKDTIKLEIVPELKHLKGSIAMARSTPPDSASSQFYFALEDLPDLDGNYAVFGKVTEGMDVVSQLREGDRMTSVTVE